MQWVLQEPITDASDESRRRRNYYTDEAMAEELRLLYTGRRNEYRGLHQQSLIFSGQ